MAYFETLGQLQNNDETFAPIYGKSGNHNNSGVASITVNGNTTGLQIGDIIMILLFNGYTSSGGGSSNIANALVSGCNKLFESNSNSKNGNNSNTMYIYIGKLIDSNITFSFTGTSDCGDLTFYRLVPR